MVETRRIYAPPEAFDGDVLLLAGERLRHLRTVLRLGRGDEFAVTDGRGAEYLARIERLGRDEGRALLLRRAEPQRESPLAVVLAQAVPKGERFSFVLEKAVELGVRGIIPVLSRRTVATGGGRAPARWQRIVESAVAQSGRTVLPPVHPPRPFSELIADPAAAELRLLVRERAAVGLREVADSRPAPRTVLIAVGPEGGWAEEEARQAEQAGFLAVRLGPRTLRTETAGIAALAALQSRWGDLG